MRTHDPADANKAVKSCFSCHKAASADDAPSAKTAFHDKCQGCHKEKLAANPKAPTKCLECHKRVSPP